MKKIIIHDTTLRDGEQAPGYAMRAHEKVEIAKILSDLRVDVIEAGFPVASQGEFMAVKEISQVVSSSRICAFCRAVRGDVDVAASSLEPAIKKGNGALLTFFPVSDLHLREKFSISREDALGRIRFAVTHARNYTDYVEFGLEDATRADPDFICRVVEVAIDSGACVVGLGDTVGYAMPSDIGNIVKNVMDRVPNIDQAVLGMHCHNDLGMALANSLAAVSAGAGQVEVTINGIGERAGNTSLEEFVMALKVRSDLFPFMTDVDCSQLTRASRALSRITGVPVPPNKAVVGTNAFGHGSGIHQSGVLKNQATYHIMDPEDVGQSHVTLVFTKHSGFAGFKEILRRNDIVLGDEKLDLAFTTCLNLADQYKIVKDSVIVQIVHSL